MARSCLGRWKGGDTPRLERLLCGGGGSIWKVRDYPTQRQSSAERLNEFFRWSNGGEREAYRSVTGQGVSVNTAPQCHRPPRRYPLRHSCTRTLSIRVAHSIILAPGRVWFTTKLPDFYSNRTGMAVLCVRVACNGRENVEDGISNYGPTSAMTVVNSGKRVRPYPSHAIPITIWQHDRKMPNLLYR